uniref:Uncharacterized protein n=1 Tax=Rhizophora mucronata TaxID=61149 RepID=A0A2P2Q285_RHIMU
MLSGCLRIIKSFLLYLMSSLEQLHQRIGLRR